MGGMAAPILYLDDIHLTFGGTPLLEGANLSIQTGDRICLVGRNGSGKSTLMKIAAGLVEQDKGERFVQPGVALHYLPQDPDISDHETIHPFTPGTDRRHCGEANPACLTENADYRLFGEFDTIFTEIAGRLSGRWRSATRGAR